MTAKPSPKMFTSMEDRPQGAKMAPHIQANIRTCTCWALPGSTAFSISHTIWKMAHRMPPIRNASGKMVALVFFSATNRGSAFRPVIWQM